MMTKSNVKYDGIDKMDLRFFSWDPFHWLISERADELEEGVFLHATANVDALIGYLISLFLFFWP